MKRDYDIIWLDSVDSTNDEVRRRIDGLDNLSVLSVLSQSCGRGQRGNSWLSEPGKNLLFSIVLKYSDGLGDTDLTPPVQAYDQFVISQLTSLAVVDLLASHGIVARIKWPNDIYVGDRKICGMLIENAVRGKRLDTSIIGIGLNINQRNFNVNLLNPTSMALCIGRRSDFDIKRCLEDFMDIFKANIDCYLTNRSCETDAQLKDSYLAKMWRLNETSGFIDYTTLPQGHLDGPMNVSTANSNTSTETSDQCGTEFTGMIRGISELGMLLVEDTCTNIVRNFGFKEIGYLLND